MNADGIIKSLQLEELTVEGGFFHELYRSVHGTSIYYLLANGQLSSWHKLNSSDEIWYFHAGSPVLQMLIFPDGSSTERVVGSDIADGHEPQSLIPAGTWQAAQLLAPEPDAWGLFGAAVFPAFEYGDFSGISATQLAIQYPELKERIMRFGV